MIFNNKIALVTGGTSGIGEEIARQLLIEGAIVFVNYCHNEEQMNQTKEEFKEYEKKLQFIKADISNELEVQDMFKVVKEKYGKLDYLINNAGTNVDDWIETFDISKWKKVINVNLVGKVICTKHAIPLLKESNTPSIVNIASRLGTKPCAGSSAYCAAEAAIINFTGSSALELSKYKIRVNTISPSLTVTPLSLMGWTKEEIEDQTKNNPLERLGETIDMANAVLFLLSDKASFINGINLNVNGGLLLK